MNVSTLKIYCDIVRHKSFSLAAKENGISQSAVSQNVLQLERNLGAKLIDRSKRPFQLTEEGLVYYEGCRELVQRYFQVENEVRNLKGQLSGSVRVAAIYSAGFAEISSCIQHFTRLHPACTVTLSYLHPHRVYTSVTEDEADLGILSYPTSRRDIAAIAWRDEKMVLACAPQHPLASLPRLAFRDLTGQNLIAFDAELAIRREIDKYLREGNAEMQIVMSFDNAETIKCAVGLGDAVAILPEPVLANELKAGTLIALNLPPPGLSRPLGIIYRKNRRLFRVPMHFIAALQDNAATEKAQKAA